MFEITTVIQRPPFGKQWILLAAYMNRYPRNGLLDKMVEAQHYLAIHVKIYKTREDIFIIYILQDIKKFDEYIYNFMVKIIVRFFSR
jgi:hypothetical protein